MDSESPKSPLYNSSGNGRMPFRRRNKSPNSPLLNEQLQQKISSILDNPGRTKKTTRRRRNRRKRTYSQDDQIDTSGFFLPSQDENNGNISFSMPEPSFPRTMSINNNKENEVLPDPASPAKIKARPILERHPSPPPSPTTSSISSTHSTTSSLYSTTSSKAPQRLLHRLEQKQKKYKVLSAKLVECERDLFDSRSQLHERIDNINVLNHSLEVKEKKLSIQRKELVEKCEEINNIKKELEKEKQTSERKKKEFEEKENRLKNQLIQSTKSHRKLLATTIEGWESKVMNEMEKGKRKDSLVNDLTSEIENLKNQLKVSNEKHEETNSKIKQQSTDLGSKEGELILLRKEKSELEKTTLCLSRHIEKERQLRQDLEERSMSLEQVSISERKKCEEIKLLENKLSRLQELREKEIKLVKRATKRLTSCCELMKENLPSVIHRNNCRNGQRTIPWSEVTNQSNLFLGEVKKKIDQYQEEVEKEMIPSGVVVDDDSTFSTNNSNKIVLFCGSVYKVIRNLISKQQDLNSVNACYVDQMKRKEFAVNKHVSRMVLRNWRKQESSFQSRQLSFCSRRM